MPMTCWGNQPGYRFICRSTAYENLSTHTSKGTHMDSTKHTYEPEAVNEHIAADIIGVSVQWLRNNRRSPSAPPFCKIGSRIRYRPETLRAWVRQQEVVNG